MNQKLIYYKIDRKNEKKIKECGFFFLFVQVRMFNCSLKLTNEKFKTKGNGT